MAKFHVVSDFYQLFCREIQFRQFSFCRTKANQMDIIKHKNVKSNQSYSLISKGTNRENIYLTSFSVLPLAISNKFDGTSV